MQLSFRVAPHEVQSCYEELKANQVEIVQPPQTIGQRVWKYQYNLLLRLFTLGCQATAIGH